MAKIAVVDDEETLRELFKDVLKEAGHDVALYASALDFERGTDGSEDAILLDDIMGGKRGISLLKELREGGVGTPVCIFSGTFGRTTEEMDFLREMAADLMYKPTNDIHDIVDYVRRRLSDPDKLLFYTGDGSVLETKKCLYRKSVENDAAEGRESTIKKCLPCRGFKTSCDTYMGFRV